MKKLNLSFSAAILLVAFLAIACTQPATPEKPASPEKMTAPQLKEFIANGTEHFFLDVRSAEEITSLGTLPGYVNIPIDELESRLGEIPKDLPVVTA